MPLFTAAPTTVSASPTASEVRLKDYLRRPEIPALHGIRALSAMAIVVYHLGYEWANGDYGVIWFFVLSGFLITHLLLKEQAKTGSISIKGFYIRRSLRILPAFYGYCALYILASIAIGRALQWPPIIASALYVNNYYAALHGRTNTMGHLWSLAVEEQFYLLWPLALTAFGANRRRAAKWLMGAILAVWIYRAAALWLGVHRDYLYFAFECRMDALALGCLLAICVHEDLLPRWIVDFRWLALVAAAVVWALNMARLNEAIEFAILPLALAILMLHAIRYCDTPIYKWLNYRPIRWLGIISYSLYLYHPVSDNVQVIQNSTLGVILQVVISIALAAGSYFIIEKPFLILKDRWSFRRTPAAPALSPSGQAS